MKKILKKAFQALMVARRAYAGAYASAGFGYVLFVAATNDYFHYRVTYSLFSWLIN